MLSKSTIAIASLIALSACATGNNQHLASTPPAAFTCPTAITVDRGEEGTYEYLGQSAKDATICKIKASGRKAQSAYYGIYPVDAEGAVENADALSKIFPLSVGKDEYADWVSMTATTASYQNRYKVASLSDITVPAGRFSAYELQVTMKRESRSTSGSSKTVTTYWIDSTSGVIIKKSVDLHGGVAMDSGAFAAERTSRPTAAQPVAVSQ